MLNTGCFKILSK